MTSTTLSPPTLEEIHEERDRILAIAAAHGVTNVRVFGSVARGDAQPDSDIDLLVDYPPHFSLLDLANLVNELEAVVGHKIEIASAAHLRDELRSYIMRDVIAL
jgi:hypothetical protein